MLPLRSATQAGDIVLPTAAGGTASGISRSSRKGSMVSLRGFEDDAEA